MTTRDAVQYAGIFTVILAPFLPNTTDIIVFCIGALVLLAGILYKPRRAVMYVADPPVARDDGRFYVPVRRVVAFGEGCSPIVLRVASDAFPEAREAEEFAKWVERRLN